MGRFFWVIQVGPVSSQESLKAAVVRKSEVRTEEESERHEAAGFEAGGGRPQSKECGWF